MAIVSDRTASAAATVEDSMISFRIIPPVCADTRQYGIFGTLDSPSGVGRLTPDPCLPRRTTRDGPGAQRRARRCIARCWPSPVVGRTGPSSRQRRPEAYACMARRARPIHRSSPCFPPHTPCLELCLGYLPVIPIMVSVLDDDEL